MKYVLRNTNTGCFLQRPGLWVARMEEAMTFEEMLDVREYCQAHRLEDVQAIQRLMPNLTSLMRESAASLNRAEPA